jgi:hypothetical protein
MTNGKFKTGSLKAGAATIISLILLILTLWFGIYLSGEVAAYVKDGMLLAVGCVIPSSFPFMLISDAYIAYGRPERIRPLGRIFTALFGLDPRALSAFICGNVGGFPIGAKMAADMYLENEISREDAERLAALSNNPSSAFVIGGVGLGIYGEAGVGIMLLLSVYIATVLSGIVTRRNRAFSRIQSDNNRQNYSFVESTKRAGLTSVSIISFISVFSVALGIIKKRVKYAFILYPVYSLLEVTNAVGGFSSLGIFPPTLRLAACAFSLGFGGFSVGMQSSVFASSRGLKMKKYYSIKLLEGILAGSIASLLNQI